MSDAIIILEEREGERTRRADAEEEGREGKLHSLPRSICLPQRAALI